MTLALRLSGFHQLEVTEHTIRFPSPGVPEGGLRVVHLTDFHCDRVLTGAEVRQVVERANGLRPDLVVLTGDYATRGTGRVEECARELARLRAPLGVFGVLGNHDIAEGAERVERALAANGVRVLTNRSAQLANGMWVVGLDDCWDGGPEVEAAFRGVPEDAVPLLLTHSAALFPRVAARPMLALCGDTHGGQVYLGAWLTQRVLRGARPYVRGWYACGPGLVYVNRGIGTMKAPVRFNARPEIAVLTLLPGSGELSVDGMDVIPAPCRPLR